MIILFYTNKKIFEDIIYDFIKIIVKMELIKQFLLVGDFRWFLMNMNVNKLIKQKTKRNNHWRKSFIIKIEIQ